MSGAVLVAIGAAIGNLLQGWDNATIAGKINESFHWLSVFLFVIYTGVITLILLI